MPVERMGDTAQTRLGSWMAPFSAALTAPTWQHVLVLITGAILSPGRRTVAAVLRVTGLDQDPCFTNYHRVLNRNCWSSLRLARCLCRLLVSTFVPELSRQNSGTEPSFSCASAGAMANVATRVATTLRCMI